MRNVQLALVAIFAVFLNGCSSSSSTDSGESRSVIVLIDDIDSDSVRFDSSVASRVIDVVSGQLSQQGHRVFGQSALSSTSRRNSRMGSAELVDLVNNSSFSGSNRGMQIDVLATVSIHVSVQAMRSATQARVRVNGRLIDANTGRFLGSYELSDPIGQFRVRPDCDFACLTERVGDYARDIGLAVGSELADSLGGSKTSKGQRNSPDRAYSRGAATSTEYAIRFDNVNSKQYTEMEDYLTDIFSGFIDLKLVNSTGTAHNISYQSRITSEHLVHNLRRAMDELGWRGAVLQNGTTFTVTRSTSRPRVTETPNSQNNGFNDW